MVYLPTLIVDFYGIHVGKYIVRPMDPSWGCILHNGIFWSRRVI